MTEKDAEIQDLRREVKRLRHFLKKAIDDLLVAMSDNPCRVCKYADADCETSCCAPEWRGIEEWNTRRE